MLHAVILVSFDLLHFHVSLLLIHHFLTPIMLVVGDGGGGAGVLDKRFGAVLLSMYVWCLVILRDKI